MSTEMPTMFARLSREIARDRERAWRVCAPNGVIDDPRFVLCACRATVGGLDVRSAPLRVVARSLCRVRDGASRR